MNFSTCVTASFLAILFWAPLTGLADGCDNSTLSSGTYTMQHGGLTRTYRVHVPRGYKSSMPTPLVTIFHGWGGNEDEFLRNRTVRSEADKRGYILVAPRGLGSGAPDDSYNSWSFSGSTTGLAGDEGAICGDGTPDYSYDSCTGTAENTCSWTHCQDDDVAFAVALVEEIKAELCVDPNNVFATGGSNGGMFTWELGQNKTSADTFRAIAPIIGLPHKGYLGGPANKARQMPVLVITGTRDTVVPPGAWDDDAFTTTSNGSDLYYYTGATAITKEWAEAYDCDTDGPASVINDGYRKPDCRTYCSGDNGLPRVLDCRARMGHTYSFSWAWKLVMDFFDEHAAPAQ
ncbi:alpha/beta hydrolase family esterase [Pseudomonadota bacterium]